MGRWGGGEKFKDILQPEASLGYLRSDKQMFQLSYL